MRNSRVSQLATQGNPELGTALRKAHEPVMAHPPTASLYQIKKPEVVVAQALNRSLPTTHAAGASVQNKLATVAGVWTNSNGSVGSSTSAAGGKPAVPVQLPTASTAVTQTSNPPPSAPSAPVSAPAAPASLKRPYTFPEQQQHVQLETSGYNYAVGSMSPTLLAMPVPMVYSIPPAYAPIAMSGGGSSSGGVHMTPALANQSTLPHAEK